MDRFSSKPPTDAAPNPLAEQLRVHAVELGITDITDSQYSQLAKYCDALWAWNEKINLTRHTDAETFAQRDLLDTWKLAKLLKEGETVLDFGSGSGVPGLTAAILRPDVRFELCDSVQKKARVLEDIAKQLRLPIEVHAVNVKSVLEQKSYDTLTSRAVGSLSKLCTWLEPLWGQFGRLLTIKGPSWVDERGEARHYGQLKTIDLRKVDEYAMPGRDSNSVILQLTQRKTDEKPTTSYSSEQPSPPA